MSTTVKRNHDQRGLSKRIEQLESHQFQLVLILMAGGFVLVGGLLTIIAALLAFVR